MFRVFIEYINMKNILFIITSTNITGTGKHPAGYEFSEVADPYLEFTNKGIYRRFCQYSWWKPSFCWL